MTFYHVTEYYTYIYVYIYIYIHTYITMNRENTNEDKTRIYFPYTGERETNRLPVSLYNDNSNDKKKGERGVTRERVACVAWRATGPGVLRSVPRPEGL